MKLTLILLTLSLVEVSAAAFGQKITLSGKNMPIEKVFESISTQSGYDILYTRKALAGAKPVNIQVKNADLPTVLPLVFDGQPLNYSVEDKTVVVTRKRITAADQPAAAKPGRITGKVLDEKGETLPGATVTLVETGAGVQAGVDGSYTLTVEPGTYTLEVSYVSFQKQRITGVVVTENKNTPLDVVLKPEVNGLKEVMVTSSYRKASVQGILARQKNAAELSNAISADQISRTPDKNIGESLKRISGVSTIDNKYVVIRGIGERYNQTTLDGTLMPSTDPQTRNFSFDLIPTNMVDNVVVSKTVTPDMNASFGGGLVQINTKDIPNENFTSLTLGASVNDQTTGKDFLSHKRGKRDYLGFDDGGRDFPDLFVTTDGTKPIVTASQMQEQNKKFVNNNYSVYRYKAAPSQNYQFAIGRIYTSEEPGKLKFGFTGSLSYRNTQQINHIEDQRRNIWSTDAAAANNGKAYGFNTTWGGLLNAGLQIGKHRFSLRNTYTHMFDNTFARTVGYSQADGATYISLGVPDLFEEYEEPTFTDLTQNKLSGQHQLGKTTIEWEVSRASVVREQKDLVIAQGTMRRIGTDFQPIYTYSYTSEPRFTPNSRQYSRNNENNYSWNAAVSRPFEISGNRQSIKAGYYGIRKQGGFNWRIAALTASPNLPAELVNIPISEKILHENMGIDKYTYTVSPFFLDEFKGRSINHAGYLMFDNRLAEILRLVWGIRTEYFKYTEIANGSNDKLKVFQNKKIPEWQWLPSASLTYSPLKSMNVRVAYSSSVVRPDLMDNSASWRYSTYLGGMFGNEGLYATRINSWDTKVEWFPGAGEILSAGAFHKKFDKPAELIINLSDGNAVYYLKSSDKATVYGLELEARKNLGFISEATWLADFSLYGNLTLQRSDVTATYKEKNPDGGADLDVPVKQRRPMFGQTPFLLNAGLQYTGKHLGLNLVYNKSGYKTYITGNRLQNIEYERPRQLLDAQVSYKFLRNRLEVKLNVANLLNTASLFYNNQKSYEQNPDYVPNGTDDTSDAFRLKKGFSDNYEKDDIILFKQRFGRTYSTSLTWNF